MLTGALRHAARAAGRAAARSTGRAERKMSGASVEEEVKEMNKWRVITYAAIPVCFGVAVYDLSQAHPHDEEMPAYSYLHIRNKAFPWGDDGLWETKHKKHGEH